MSWHLQAIGAIAGLASATYGAWTVVTRTAGTEPGQANATVPEKTLTPKALWFPDVRDVKEAVGPSVYIVRKRAPGEERDRVKIGVADRSVKGAAYARVRQWRAGSEYPLDWVALLPGGPDLEAALHREFSQQRPDGRWERVSDGAEGSEWFVLPVSEEQAWRPRINRVHDSIMGVPV